MAGLVTYVSAVVSGTAGLGFPYIYIGAGANASASEETLGIAASLSADTTWMLRFPMPPTIPTGTLKLRLLGLANATSGAAKLTVSDKNVAAAASPSGATLSAETQSTVTWGAGDNDKYKEVKVTLTTAPAGNDMLVVAVTFNTTGWTLASVSGWIPTIIWE